MKHLSYFESIDSALNYSGEIGVPHVAFCADGEGKIAFSGFPEGEVEFKFENGELKLVEKAPDPTEGFVDLGLSVMWASCNLGASNPEETGLYYSRGEVTGHELNADKTGFTDGHVFNSNLGNITAQHELLRTEYDAVSVYYSDKPAYKTVSPCMPTAAEAEELLNNTTQQVSTLNGVDGVLLTSNINGNSIFLPWSGVAGYYDPVFENISLNSFRTSTKSYNASRFSDYNSVIFACYSRRLPFYLSLYDDASLETANWIGMPIRGVCSYPPKNGVKMLEFGLAITISSESSQLYCFPRTWTNVEFKAPTTGEVKLYVSQVADFAASADDPNLLTTYELELSNGARQLQMSLSELALLTSYAEGDYMYVRIVASEPTTLSIDEWQTSECADNSTHIRVNVAKYINSKDPNIYRLRYADIAGCKVTISWTHKRTALPVWIAEDCNISTVTTADNLLINPRPIVPKNSKLVIEGSVVDSWASRVAEDGFIYLKFNPQNGSNVTFVTEKIASADPVYTTDNAAVTDCGCETE